MFERTRTLFRMARGLSASRRPARSNRTLALLFEQQAGSSPDHPFLLFEEQRFTYGEGNAAVNRHVRAYEGLGVAQGDTIALMMDNRPEFLWHFLAAGKLGATVSLINTHNSGKPLVHALQICSPKLIVIGSEHAAAFDDIRGDLGLEAPVLVDVEGDAGGATFSDTVFGSLMEGASEDDPASTSQQNLDQLGAYIYTSGTTGLPKAAKMRHARMHGIAMAFGGMGWAIRRDDRIYNPLPLYHTSGLIVCTSAVIAFGATLVLARRFSARRFWEDVREHDCTGFVYIGELCRYLMNQPPRDDDADNRIRVVVGNGLRPDIWAEFQQRFGIGKVREFYGSTEGNVGSLNLDGTVGSVGRLIGRGSALVKGDDEADDFLRGPDGVMVRCRADEPGVLIGRIAGGAGSFDGYQDGEATKKKILTDVFRKGDAYFNSGDMLRTDRRRRLYFVDRMGDTFRWKGENVSTFEVQEQISSWSPVEEINVYGVQVPHADGRAGMASVVLSNEFDPAAFKHHIDEALPGYARPIFVRVQQAMDTTGTLKLKKADLRDEGFDPRVVRDPLYFRHPEEDAYVPLSEALFAQIERGELRI